MKSFSILPRKIISVVATFCFFSLAPLLSYASTNLALNKPVTASSSENASLTPEQAVDDNLSSRWSSDFTDDNWITVDLGDHYQITGVKFHWQNSYAKDYHIQTSADGNDWLTIHTTTDNPGGIDEVSLSGVGRFVRMQGLRRATRYGYSMFNFEVYGQPPSEENIALNKPATASTIENGSLTADKAVDDDLSTRWSSDFTDHNWIAVDLGSVYQITGAQLSWQNSYSKDYDIQTSFDGVNWVTIHSTIDSDGGVDEMVLNGQGRYVRVEGFRRATRYGHSLWDLQVFGYQIMESEQESTSSSSSESSSSSAASEPAPEPEPALEPALEAEPSAESDLALHQVSKASSVENNNLGPESALDGDSQTRWSSSASDQNWISVDLGAVYSLTGVKLNWEAAYGKDYEIQASEDGVTWKTLHAVTGGDGGIDEIDLQGKGRHVKMNGIARATRWGYSLWDFEIYGVPFMPEIVDISSGKPATSSTDERASRSAEMAFDAQPSTRWSSSRTDDNWLAVDLGSVHALTEVTLTWETAYGQDYEVQASNDGLSWQTLSTVVNGDGGIDTVSLNGEGRYVRMYGLKRGTIWGYSLWEMQVFGYDLYQAADDSSTGSSGSSSSSTSSSSSSSSSSPPAPVDETAPSVPGNLKADHIDLDTVSLSWSAATDDVEVISYLLYRDGVELIELVASSQSYLDSGLSAGTTYSYSLKAGDAAGNVSEQSTTLTLSTLTLVEPETGATLLEWVTPQARENGAYLEMNEIGGYEIQYKKATDSDYQLLVLEDPTVTQYKFEGLEGDYVFKIAVFDTNGLYSQFVDISPVAR